MTYIEIIEKLKTIFTDVDGFAHENLPYKVANYPEAVKAQEVRKEFANTHIINWKWDSEDNQKIYQSLPNEHNIAKSLCMQDLGLQWEQVDQYGGEGKGDTWYSIKYFPEYDIYIRVDGWYQSYNGTEFHDGWDSCKEVRPQQKTIIVYE